jgi:hypothetical protein
VVTGLTDAEVIIKYKGFLKKFIKEEVIKKHKIIIF